MLVAVDDDDVVGAHHERIARPVFPLQVLEEDVRLQVTLQAEEAADDGERRQSWKALSYWLRRTATTATATTATKPPPQEVEKDHEHGEQTSTREPGHAV